ncbi:MAG: AMP-binding protein, partial [Parvularculaceae bacterium]
MTANIFERFRRAWRDRLDRPAIVEPGASSYSYGDIDRLSAQFAAALIGLGLAPGERVVAQVEKSVGAVALYLATLRAGGVFIPLNTAYTPSEVAFFLEDARPCIFICQPEKRAALASVARAANVSHVAELGPTAADGFWRAALELAPFNSVVSRDGEDLASILYTSGTTGRSKGAMLSHRALATNAEALSDIWGLSSSDVLLHALPIFHIHGLFVALNTSFLNASTIIFLSSFTPHKVRKHLRDATVMMGVPTYYSRLLDDGITRDECRHIRLFISGSAPLTEEASNAWMARTGCKILERYGMTEAGMIASNPLAGE